MNFQSDFWVSFYKLERPTDNITSQKTGDKPTSEVSGILPFELG